MSTPTAEQIRQLSEQTKNFAPEPARRQPLAFLTLAPTTSDSHPRTQKPKQQTAAPTTITTDPIPVVDTDASKRRTSSLGSDKSSPTGLRFLKLGPVHWGEHQGEHQADWHEVEEQAVEDA